MIVIGERINGMFKKVREAIQKKDAAYIQDLAARQMKAGADILDINVGTASAPDAGLTRPPKSSSASENGALTGARGDPIVT